MSTRPGRRSSLARLLRLAVPEWRSLAAGLALLAVGALTSLLYPQGIRIVIDGALAGSDGALIDRTALAMVVLAALQGLAFFGRYSLFTIAGERVVTRLRERLYGRLLDQEVAFFDEQRTGDLVSRLASDTTLIQGAVSTNLSLTLRQLAQAVGGIGFLLYTSPLLTLLMLAVVPAIAGGAVVYGRRLRRLSAQVQDALADASAVAEESLSGIRTVRAFAAEPHEAGRYRGAVQRAFGLARARAFAGAIFMGAVSSAGYIAAALVFWYGGHLVRRGEMTVGGLTSFLIYSLIVGFSLGGLADLWADFMKAAGAAERVFALVDRVPAIAPTGGLAPPAVRGALAFEGVEFAYPARPDAPVLRGIDLAIAPGEVVALVGPSGAGKSTLAALVSRLYDPQRGRVLLDGTDLTALDPAWLRRRVGVVAQEPILFSTTIAENIRYGRPDASDAEVEAAARAANAHGFVSAFPDGYRTAVGERGVQLSGGQKQRVAIARAVLKDPRVLLLDEATSALDAESEHLVKEALERLMRGRTTLIIAHRLSTVAGANRVVVLDGGAIVESGTHQALLERAGLYRRLVERQFVAA